jgi:hypothetical protein
MPVRIVVGMHAEVRATHHLKVVGQTRMFYSKIAGGAVGNI